MQVHPGQVYFYCSSPRYKYVVERFVERGAQGEEMWKLENCPGFLNVEALVARGDLKLFSQNPLNAENAIHYKWPN